MSNKAADFVSVTTVHFGTVTWTWADKVRPFDDYIFTVRDSVDKKVKELEKKFDVTNDTRFCCQCEGIQLFGSERSAVEKATRELSHHLARFKDVVALGA